MSTTEKLDLYQVVTNHFIEQFSNGIAPWRKPWLSAGPPVNAISKRPYQSVNLWMLTTLPFTSNLYLTFEQLKKVNGSVLKGQHGTMVLYWEQDNSGQQNQSQNPKQQQSHLKYRKVFNVEQCTGIPPSILAWQQEKQLYPGIYRDLIYLNMPDRPEIRRAKKQAFYDVAGDFINMPKGMSQESDEYYIILFHQLVHSTTHDKRLGRKAGEMFEVGGEECSQEEMITEIATYHLANHAGVIASDAAATLPNAPIWIEKLRADKRLIVQTCSMAQKAVDYILNTQKQDGQHSAEK